MNEVLLGIDAGTSAIKVCAFDAKGSLLKKVQRFVPIITPYPLWAEIDLQRYWELLVQALHEVSMQTGPITSVGLSTTCPTTIFLDKNLKPLRHAMVYLDGRSDEIIGKVTGSDMLAFQKISGNRASTSTCWAANLNWVKENEPEVWNKVHKVCMLNSYIAMRLTGNLAIDPTQASYSGLVDVQQTRPQWSEKLLALWDTPANFLPPLLEGSQLVGCITSEVSNQIPIASGVPVALGVADTAAAAFAMQLYESGQVFESVGTSGVISFCLDQPDFELGFLNRYHVYPSRWLAHGAMSTLGGSFGWLQSKIWPEVQSLAELERLAQESLPGSNGLIFLPYLAGERSPIWDAQASAAWIGLRLAHNRADMIRAVFEGTAFGLRQIMDLAQAKWGLHPAKLVGVGGGSHSRFWAHIKADILQLDYGMTEFQDASALGAAMLGGVASGYFSGLQDNALPCVKVSSQWVKPSKAPHIETYKHHFDIFTRLYPVLSESMHFLGQKVPS
ncbi:MAG: XylB [Betaproteobacteria bacterium]|jgi:xylulokinase|nr:FGGY family carbohydrate kinase [Burkholderiales bacterium]NBX91573.1 XylB [Betaproteobacteria bacterium]